MNDYIIEPAKTEDYESILELYNELHEVLEECNPLQRMAGWILLMLEKW